MVKQMTLGSTHSVPKSLDPVLSMALQQGRMGVGGGVYSRGVNRTYCHLWNQPVLSA